MIKGKMLSYVAFERGTKVRTFVLLHYFHIEIQDKTQRDGIIREYSLSVKSKPMKQVLVEIRVFYEFSDQLAFELHICEMK